jgi:hypothetical protein
MNTPEDRNSEDTTIPMQPELEACLGAKIVTFDDGGVNRPGGMCGCCGSGPNIAPDWRAEPWYIYRAGICDADGVYFSMLCEDCLEELRESNINRPKSLRDEIAESITDLLGDDIDGAQTFMDDLES